MIVCWQAEHAYRPQTVRHALRGISATEYMMEIDDHIVSIEHTIPGVA
jgi:hypothetical protein